MGEPMNKANFEGTRVLEKLAAVGTVDEFLEAVDDDDFGRAKRLLQAANVDPMTIRIVLQKMRAGDGEH